MGRHADPVTGRRRGGGRRPLRVSVPVVAICVLLAGAIALGVWWWNLRSVTDPIDADPVDGYALVISSPPCSAGTRTTVQVTGPQPAVTASLSGCGFSPGQQLAVQYLAGHPQQVRLAGTSTSGTAGLTGKLLPIGILAAGLVAVFATIALMVERRRSRHLAAAKGISVADLAARTAAARRGIAAGSGPPGPGDREPGTGRAGTGEGADGGEGRLPAGPERRDRAGQGGHTGDGAAGLGEKGDGVGGDGGAGDREVGDGDAGDGDAGNREVGDGDAGDLAGGVGPSPVDPSALPSGEPAHVLPSGFVIVDEQLFTHSGTEAPGRPDRSGP